MVDITIVNFSGKNGFGNCSRIADYIFEKYKKKNVINVIKYSDYSVLPCGKCDYTCLEPDVYNCDFEDETSKIYKIIGKCDIAFLLVPIYSDYPCSNYFIFRERSQAIANDEIFNLYCNTQKCFIFIANTGKKNLLNIVETEPGINNQYIILSTHDFGTKGYNGDLIESDECKSQLENFINKYIISFK